jgi:hypothetical protein
MMISQDFMEEVYRLEFALAILDAVYQVVSTTNIMDKVQIQKINRYRNLYLIWVYILRNVHQSQLTLHAMKHYWIYEKEELTGEFYENTKRRFELADQKYFSNVFKEVIYPVVGNDLKEMFDSEVMALMNKDTELINSIN